MSYNKFSTTVNKSDKRKTSLYVICNITCINIAWIHLNAHSVIYEPTLLQGIYLDRKGIQSHYIMLMSYNEIKGTSTALNESDPKLFSKYNLLTSSEFIYIYAHSVILSMRASLFIWPNS